MESDALKQEMRDLWQSNVALNKTAIELISQFDVCVAAVRETDQFFSDGWPIIKGRHRQSDRYKECRVAVEVLMRDKLQAAHAAINRYKARVRKGERYGAYTTLKTAKLWRKKEADRAWLKEVGALYGVFLGRENGQGEAV